MKALDNYVCTGQMTIFDFLDPGSWSGKTSQEPSVQIKEKTSGQSLKKFAELRIKPPMYLDLRTENGVRQAASWEIVGPLLGEYTMLSFGECPSVENVSRLSQILEDSPHPKYCLSAKACQGILNRANRRGKKLPEILEKALIRQASPLKLGGGVEVDSKGKKAGKGALVQTELSGTLGVSQDQTLITTQCAGFKAGQSCGGLGFQEECSPTLSADMSGLEPTVYCLQGNGIDRADTAGCNGKGWREDQCYTLNTIDRPAVCTYQQTTGALMASGYDKLGTQEAMNDMYVVESMEVFHCTTETEKVQTLKARDYKDPQVVCYGLDRASFNQGKNAQYDFSVQAEIAQPLVARGPGGVMTQQ